MLPGAEYSHTQVVTMNELLAKGETSTVAALSEPQVLHTTGAVRSVTDGKGRFDLIPWDAIRRLALHHQAGAVKYPENNGRNWEKGLPLSRYYGSAMGHLAAFAEGKRDEDHLAAVLWNVCAYIHTEQEIKQGRLPAALNDVPWAWSL